MFLPYCSVIIGSADNDKVMRLTWCTVNGTIIPLKSYGGIYMANSELSKLKILYLYDYFKKKINAYEEDSAVSVNEIIAYLENETGNTFERKSIYADINKINEYVKKSGQASMDDWIFTEGKKYKRGELTDEITIDEARLIVDAISTTPFVDTQLCDKIIKMFPTYFPSNYQKRALIPHDKKITTKSISYINIIRKCIDEKSSVNFEYGYLLGSTLAERNRKNVSPMALDWDNNCYYLIAIDNSKAKDLERDETLSKALRRYRIDRIASISSGNRKEYITYSSDRLRKQELKRFNDNSLSAYSSDRIITVRLTLVGTNAKDVLKAYGAFVSRMHNDVKIEDDTKLDSGVLKFYVNTGKAPTLYTDLFELSTFENVAVIIEDEEICKEYAEYIKKAAKAAKLESL